MKGKLNLFKLKDDGVIELTEGEQLSNDYTEIKIDGKIYGLKIKNDLFKLKILTEIFNIKRSIYHIKLFGIILCAIIIIMLGLCISLSI